MTAYLSWAKVLLSNRRTVCPCCRRLDPNASNPSISSVFSVECSRSSISLSFSQRRKQKKLGGTDRQINGPACPVNLRNPSAIVRSRLPLPEEYHFTINYINCRETISKSSFRTAIVLFLLRSCCNIFSWLTCFRYMGFDGFGEGLFAAAQLTMMGVRCVVEFCWYNGTPNGWQFFFPLDWATFILLHSCDSIARSLQFMIYFIIICTLCTMRRKTRWCTGHHLSQSKWTKLNEWHSWLIVRFSKGVYLFFQANLFLSAQFVKIGKESIEKRHTNRLVQRSSNLMAKGSSISFPVSPRKYDPERTLRIHSESSSQKGWRVGVIAEMKRDVLDSPVW